MSGWRFAEEEGVEPPVPLGTPVFKTGAFNRSATPPEFILNQARFRCPNHPFRPDQPLRKPKFRFLIFDLDERDHPCHRERKSKPVFLYKKIVFRRMKEPQQKKAHPSMGQTLQGYEWVAAGRCYGINLTFLLLRIILNKFPKGMRLQLKHSV